MKLVIIESPFAGNKALNVAYARAALLDSLHRHEAPMASHLLYPQVLDDDVPLERMMGLDAGWEWIRRADLVAVYADLGISPGMELGIARAMRDGIPVDRRCIPGWDAGARPHFGERRLVNVVDMSDATADDYLPLDRARWHETAAG